MLVGRQPELQAIDRLAAAARLGTSGMLALTGEPGVGKTALVGAALERLADMRVLRATGLEAEREIPFATLLQLLRPALGALDGLPPMQADALATALALPRPGLSAAAVDRFTIGAAALSLVCRYAEEGPARSRGGDTDEEAPAEDEPAAPRKKAKTKSPEDRA